MQSVSIPRDGLIPYFKNVLTLPRHPFNTAGAEPTH